MDDRPTITEFAMFRNDSPAEEVIVIDPMGDKGLFEKTHRAHLITTARLRKLKERNLLTSPVAGIASVCEEVGSEVDCPSRIKQLCRSVGEAVRRVSPKLCGLPKYQHAGAMRLANRDR